MDNDWQTKGQDAIGSVVQQLAISEVRSLRRFVRLEGKLIGSNLLYVPEIGKDMLKRLAGHSPFYSDMQHALFVVSDGKSDKARCAALINRRYQKAKDEAVGFIGHFSAAPEADKHVRAILEKAEAWLQERNVVRVIAHYNGSVFLGMGLLTAAYDEEPMFPFGWHPPYYRPYFQNSGYHATYPLWFYTIDFASEKYRTVAQAVKENKSVNVRPINKKNWDADLETYRNVLNESFREEWEFHPFTAEEFQAFFDAIKPVLDSRLMLMAEVNGKVVGVCWGLPDWNRLFRSFKSKSGPIQIIRFMLRAGRYHRAGLVLIGILQGYRGTGVAQALAITLYKTYQEKGLKEASYMCVNESNLPSRRFAESMGGKGRVLYHCYDKTLP